jgi:hypothetical protein
MAYNPNQAHPKIQYKGTYPNMHVSQDAGGFQIIKSIQPGLESLFHVTPTGSYTGHGPSGEKVKVTVGKEHKYNADGVSSTADGHTDTKVAGNARNTVAGGGHEEHGGNKYAGGGGVNISGSRDSQINAATSGDKFDVTEGKVATDHTGNVSRNVTGNIVENVKGNKVNMVTGDYGINIQGGAYDVQVAKDARLKVSNQFYLISDFLLQLKVQNSIISMLEAGTIVVSADGTLMLNAKNSVEITGKINTKIQGGGPVAPPTTFR